MENPASLPSNEPKPISEFTRSELVRLPELSRSRLRVRRFARWLARLLARWFLDPKIAGLENIPAQGPVLIVGNHIGDGDEIMKIAFLPRLFDPIAKIELYDISIIGKIIQAYGVIWIRRGQPDRQALKAALQGLADGRMISINPEGRESMTGALEEATHGAAFLALKSKAIILPVAITGAYNHILFSNMRRLRRTKVTFTVGRAIQMPSFSDRQAAVAGVTVLIMQAIADMLPPEYQGVYTSKVQS